MYQSRRRRCSGALLLTAMVALVAISLGEPAAAQSSSANSRLTKQANQPVMAVVALRSQRVTVYSARGKMLESPVSTGQSGYETPAGIYSVIERQRDHYSNIYDDAAMPFMQRITWSGIALHAGNLPGYPASHGCIRMPYGFAARLFGLTRRGMRVVVVRDDVSPVDFAHPALFRPADPSPAQDSVAGTDDASPDRSGARLEKAAVTSPSTRRLAAAAKLSAADAAADKADEARRIAAKTADAAADVEEALEFAQEARVDAETEIAQADRLLASEDGGALAPKLNAIKARAQERLAAAQAQIDTISAEGKAKIEAALAAREVSRAARAAYAAVQSEAKQIAAQLAPVSVFISRKTRRLHVRQAFEPLFESEVTIHKPNAAIGTTVFTALSYTNEYRDLRWSALSMYPASGQGRSRGAEPAGTDAGTAKAALERISMPQETMDRINELITPGSSLIISDEDMSRETSKGTDFIVLMSGEPQGGIRRRPRTSYVARNYDGPSPGIFNLFSWW